MSYLRLNFALPILMASTFATQAMADDYFDNAPVLSVTPQVERVNTPPAKSAIPNTSERATVITHRQRALLLAALQVVC